MVLGLLDHFHSARGVRADPLHKHRLVALVNLNDIKRGERFTMLVEEPDAALALRNVGSVDQNPKHKAIRVNNQVPLATLDIFGSGLT